MTDHDDRCLHCRGIVRCSTCGRPPGSAPATPVGRKHNARIGPPIHEAAMEAKRVAEINAAKPSKPRTYKPKPCACGDMFVPTGGRDTKCPKCKGARHQESHVSQ